MLRNSAGLHQLVLEIVPFLLSNKECSKSRNSAFLVPALSYQAYCRLTCSREIKRVKDWERKHIPGFYQLRKGTSKSAQTPRMHMLILSIATKIVPAGPVRGILQGGHQVFSTILMYTEKRGRGTILVAIESTGSTGAATSASLAPHTLAMSCYGYDSRIRRSAENS